MIPTPSKDDEDDDEAFLRSIVFPEEDRRQFHDDGHDDGQELITDIAPPAVIGECHSYPKHGPLSRLSFGGNVKCRRKIGAV